MGVGDRASPHIPTNMQLVVVHTADFERGRFARVGFETGPLVELPGRVVACRHRQADLLQAVQRLQPCEHSVEKHCREARAALAGKTYMLQMVAKCRRLTAPSR